MNAPQGPKSGFGKETTLQDYMDRIAWETWARDQQKELGYQALADAHELARVSYQETMEKKFPSTNG